MATKEQKLEKLRETLEQRVKEIEEKEGVTSFLFDSGTLDTGIVIEEPVSGRTQEFYINEEDITGDIPISEKDLDQYWDILDDIRILSAKVNALEDIEANGFNAESLVSLVEYDF